MSHLDFLRKTTNKKLEQYRQAKQTYDREKAALEKAILCCENTIIAQEFLQRVAQSVQETAHEQIAGIVSRCLAAVFDDPYEFRILFERKRGKTEARLVFIREGHEVDPMTAAGGGVVDVAAFALKLACLLLTTPRPRKLLVLDEPFKHLSVEQTERVSEMLETLATDLGVQFIVVTHNKMLQAGKVIRLESQRGENSA
jgi:DNA repair exonuclease SbcCD ATPase subunit